MQGRKISKSFKFLSFCVALILSVCGGLHKIAFAANEFILHVGDFGFKTHTDKRTSPSLCVGFDGNPQTYYIDLHEDNGYEHGLRVEYNNRVYSAGGFELFYEETSFNNCKSVQLPKGFYCVDVLGGRGGDGGSNSGSGVTSNDVKHECFEVTETTNVSVFRGGDGNNGDDSEERGQVRSGGGGGASGVPSLFAMGNTILVSNGGAGGNGGSGYDYNGNNKNCGAGGGGNISGGGNGTNGMVNASMNNNFFVCGGGGGGAVSGSGGTSATGTALLILKYTADAGGNATANAAGGGGNAHRTTSEKSGGSGGNNVSYSCGVTSLVSYGGGGGGAVCARSSSYTDLDGAAGGSGSTGTSSTSYVRIYRFE